MIPKPTVNPDKKLALVLSGGGARGAYEAGIIHYIRTQLPPNISRKRSFDILCGSSVGAVNTCFLAATCHNLEYQGQRLFEIWNTLRQEDIYRRGVGSLTRLVGRTFSGIFRNILLSEKKRGEKINGHNYFKGLLDTTPFPRFLIKIIPWKQISLNIQSGIVRALTVTATNLHTGKVEFFIDKHPSMVYGGRHKAHFLSIEAEHAMASAAIPIVFPAVRIQRNYYCDGGLRLNTPISPAIHLGADKALVIGLHHTSEKAEPKPYERFTDYDSPPTLGEIIGQILKSVYMDRIEYDLAQMDRINLIIRSAEETYGDDFLSKINAHLVSKGIQQDIALRGLKKLEVMSIFPSADIRKVFSECILDTTFTRRTLSLFEKLLLRILDVDLKHGHDFLSFILFIPTYLKRMLELGFDDARRHHDQLIRFFEE